MQSVVLVIHLMIVLALIVVVLLQRSEGGGLGMGGGGNFMSSRGTANVLTRATAILATGFFLTSITLAVLATQGRGSRSLLDRPASTPTAPAGTPAPAGAPAPGPDVRKPHWAKRRVLWPLRNVWRSLTSMRTALVLLFLLALAAIPGALLPQRTSW